MIREMEKKTYIVPTTERIVLRLYQSVMDLDYGDVNVTSTEGLIINARKGEFEEEEMETDSSLPVYHSLWDDEE